MSDWTVHLEFEEGASSKFWRARVEGKTLYVNYGKIGSNGQTQVKDLADPAAAKKEYDKLVAEKRKKGYVDTGSGGRAPADEDGDEDAASNGADDED
ncbi:MAG TPA: WGR domain-containing protein, partial [Kofleriaceae bacterium]